MPELTSSIADLILDSRTVMPSILVWFEAKMWELWWLELTGLSFVDAGDCDRQWGRSVVGTRLPGFCKFVRGVSARFRGQKSSSCKVRRT